MEQDDTRERLVRAARTLALERGFRQSSLARIAQAAGVPTGNVYYWFKTKEELADAVVEGLRAEERALRQGWDALADPRDRLVALVQRSVSAGSELTLHGCPIGSLCVEFNKREPLVAERAGDLFRDLLGWIERQVAEIVGDDADAGELALHLLAMLQGAAIVAQALGSEAVIEQECARATSWVRSLEGPGA